VKRDHKERAERCKRIDKTSSASSVLSASTYLLLSWQLDMDGRTEAKCVACMPKRVKRGNDDFFLGERDDACLMILHVVVVLLVLQEPRTYVIDGFHP
jgi:hypothetical protein